MKEPRTLMEAIRYYADPDVAFEAAKQFVYPNGVHCPTCGRTDVRFIATRRMWECKDKHPRKQFSVKVGTLMEDSPLGLDIWFAAIWTIANDKNGISSYEFAKLAGITQKSAWHLLHRIRLAMKIKGGGKLGGDVEIDEVFIGGKPKNMHAHKRARNLRRSGTHYREKAIVMGLLQRTSDQALSHVRLNVVRNVGVHTVKPVIKSQVEKGARVHTDGLPAYTTLLRDGYEHGSVNHAAEEYVRGNVHTNGIENFWSLLRRTLGGTYVSVEPFHLVAYLDEQAYRFNERKSTDGERFRKLASSITGLRLTWKELTGNGEDAGEFA
jgi:transposase-like protein